MRHPFVESKPVVSSVLVADGTVHCRFMDIINQKLCGDGKDYELLTRRVSIANQPARLKSSRSLSLSSSHDFETMHVISRNIF